MSVKSFIAGTAILIAALHPSPGFAESCEQTGQTARLAAILKRSADYCRRLDKAALDFVCLEEVTETSRNYTPNTDVYLYDYQFVRKKDEVKEARNLLSVNGKKAASKNVALHTAFFQYKNVLFGPVGLLSESWQAFHDYAIVGEETVRDEKAVIVEATPKPAFKEPHPYGRIWIKEEDGSILRIVWDQRSLGNYRSIEEWAKEHDAEPRITALSEYRFEKNGLRFPSRSYTEQAYVRKDGRKLSNAEISILYKDYKFFTVETQVVY